MSTSIIKKIDKNLLVASVILSFALLASFSMVARADSEVDITFPVAELGNCKDKADCKSFCDNPENIDKCVSFAKEHNLISETEAARAEKFAKAGPGPGGCEGIACKTYCDDISHAEECIAFAKEHGLAANEEIEKIQKISALLKSGAETPGGCRGKDECETYCSEASHAEECLAFAEKAGFMPKEELERARKMIPLMQKGETPGGCKSKDQCEAYCQSGEHFDECIAFAEKAGVISPQELEMAKKTGGKGPGGCAGREQCEAFCNNPANQETCFNFAKEHGFVNENEIKNIKEGMGQMRMGLDKAPEEVKSCLKENVGENIIQEIETGSLTPGPEIGERVRSCFENFMPKVREKMGEEFGNAPDEVKTCLESAVGKEGMDKIRNGEPPEDQSTGEKIRACFESAGSRMINGDYERRIPDGRAMPEMTPNGGIENQERQRFPHPGEMRKPEGMMPMPPYEAIPEGIRGISPPPGINITIPKTEYEYQKPPYPTETGYPIQSGYPAYPGVQETQVKFSFPPESIECVSAVYGKETIEKITIGAVPPPPDVKTRIEECMAKLNPSPSVQY